MNETVNMLVVPGEKSNLVMLLLYLISVPAYFKVHSPTSLCTCGLASTV